MILHFLEPLFQQLKKKQENFKDLTDLQNSIDLDFITKISNKIDKMKETFDND